MLDARVRQLIDPPLAVMGARLAAAGVRADAITLGGFAVGLLAVPLLAAGAYGWALLAILANRLGDGLDGAVARCTQLTDLGGFLDIVCDFLFYAAVVFGFVLAEPHNRVPGAFLLLSFIGTGSSFLAFAIFAVRRGVETRARGAKSFYYLGGLTEGTETIALFVALCLFPGAFALFAWLFGAACWLTTLGRFLEARRVLAAGPR